MTPSRNHRSARSRIVTTSFVLLLVVAEAWSPGRCAVETYEIDADHSNVGFKIRHLVSYVSGQFTDFSGTIRIDRDDLEASSVELRIAAESIDTANEKRDVHLRSDEFFDVERHPEITFKSSSIAAAGGDTFNVSGVLRMHGVENDVTVPVEILGFTSHARFGNRAGFSARLTLDRREYGIDWNLPMEAGSLVLGNEVQIEIDIEAYLP